MKMLAGQDVRRFGLKPGCAQVERCWLLTTSGEVEMLPGPKGMPPVAPTFTPAAADRTHTTRATANADRRARPMQEVELCPCAPPTSLIILGFYLHSSVWCCIDKHGSTGYGV